MFTCVNDCAVLLALFIFVMVFLCRAADVHKLSIEKSKYLGGVLFV